IFEVIVRGEKSDANEVSVTLMTSSQIKKINAKFRDVDAPTDILSFPDGEFRQAGDLLLCPSYIKTKAKEYGHTIRQHYALLCIHGMLHLLGYDHKRDVDYKKMKHKEDYYFKKLQGYLSVSKLNY
ncbi:rRNA maturation RNase YbeY, partial [Candidatus Falkowbacteria bacterium]|nr:rRNA maturation RNase YbeY [Candidatus Falkowbacteria bacterium]